MRAPPLREKLPTKMDTVITFEEASLLLANPPAVAPMPNFTNLCALREWLEECLKRLTHPVAHVMSWAGLVMVLVLYALIEAIAFTAPNNPGLIPPTHVIGISQDWNRLT